MKISEIRHLEGVKGNFGIIDEREYHMHIIHQELQAPTQMIYCNVKTLSKHNNFFLIPYGTKQYQPRENYGN